MLRAAAALACALCLARTPATEDEVKAAFLFNVARFVEWPQAAFTRPDAPLIIGILGDGPFGEALGRVVDGKVLEGRALTVHRFRSVRDFRPVQILFVSRSGDAGLVDVLEAVKGSPVLTVGEEEGFARLGGMVHLSVEEGRVRFGINVDSARRAGLKVSSRLLGLARAVVSEAPRGRAGSGGDGDRP